MSCVANRTRSTSQKQLTVKPYKADYDNLQTTILNLNDDCLEEVFFYLDINDLLNVFEAHSQFKIASERAFGQRNKQIPVVVSNIHASRVNVRMIKYSSKLLQTFGHLITKLCIQFKLEKIDRLLEAIVKYCNKNVTELEFYHLGIRVKEPSVLYDNGLRNIRSFLRQLSTQFPNLLSLNFNYRNLTKGCPYSDNIVLAYPNLTSFTAAGLLLSFENIKRFIDLNSQLESLTLKSELENFMETARTLKLSENFITYLDASLPRLKHLEINRVSIENIPQLVEYQSRFKNLRKLTYGSFPTAYYPDRGYLSFLGEEIEDVELYTFQCVITHFSENITRFKKLKTLTLNLENSLEFRGAVNLIFQPTAILVWSANGIRQLILENKQLAKIVIRRHRPGDKNYYVNRFEDLQDKYYEVIKDKLNGAQWRVDGVAKCFTFSKAEI